MAAGCRLRTEHLYGTKDRAAERSLSSFLLEAMVFGRILRDIITEKDSHISL
jgi:hypothetical protein